MRKEPIPVTREALYEMVWKTPLSRLGAHFGISNVGLAKICKRLEIPIPGRGYWARLASGQKIGRPRLRKASEGTAEQVTIARHEPSTRVASDGAPAPVEALQVEVSDSLAHAHSAVRRLVTVLGDHEPDRDKTYRLRGDSEAMFRVSATSKRRALLILDALLKTLDERGHKVDLKVPAQAYGTYELSVKVGTEVVKRFIAEPLVRQDHKLTAKEEADRVRYGSSYAPKHDFVHSGRLTLNIRAWYARTKGWSDGVRRKLEDVLGTVVLGIEDLARRTAAWRADSDERDRRREEEERHRQSVAVLRNYEQALGDDLEATIDDLRRADAIRALVEVAAAAPIPPEKAMAVHEWLEWAARWANHIDPRTNPLRAARVVRPDPAAMHDWEFKFWRDWPASLKRAEDGYGRVYGVRGI